MKKLAMLLCLYNLITLSYAQEEVYEDALDAASYAVKHTKNAQFSDNIYHLREYAEMSILAFKKVESLIQNCDCNKGYKLAYLAKTDMQRLMQQDTYERGRFFAKRAKQLGVRLLEQITLCQAGFQDEEDVIED